jgi:hypothetical protein
MEKFERIPKHEPTNDNTNAIADIFSLSSQFDAGRKD